ncbi:hypothetical protein EMCRGX_G024569 [Ephydatia muelleri]
MMAVKLAFSVVGGSFHSKPPVTILHGLLGSQRNWRPLAGKISDYLERAVYILDARNHGDSPHSKEMSYEHMAQDVVHLWEDHGIRRSVLLGHSMGGKTAMVTSLLHPDLVEQLVVVDVAPTPYSRALGEDSMEKLISVLASLPLASVKSRADADELLKVDISVKTLRQFLLTNLVFSDRGGTPHWRVNLDIIKASLDQIRGFPHFKEPFRGPTLFIGGSRSDYISEQQIPEVKRLFPNAVVSYIPGAGHWPHYDEPAQLLKIVTDFCTKYTLKQ